LRPLEFEHMFSTTVYFPKDPSVELCVGSHWLTYSWRKFKQIYFQKYHHQERLDPVKWIPKQFTQVKQQSVSHKYIKTNPPQRQTMIFMHIISKTYSNQQIFQYSKKHKNLQEQRKIQRISWNEKRCSENAKISREIHKKNTQHYMINQQKCSAVWMAEKARDE